MSTKDVPNFFESAESIQLFEEAKEALRQFYKNEGFGLRYGTQFKKEGFNMGGHTVARHYGQGLSIPSLLFSKFGSEIKVAIDTRIADFNATISESEKIIKEVCENREIDAAEVLAAGDDANLQEAYSMKAMKNAPKASSLVRELEEDINKLKSNSFLIVRTKVSIDELSRVKRNLQDDRKFDLTFDEICALGF